MLIAFCYKDLGINPWSHPSLSHQNPSLINATLSLPDPAPLLREIHIINFSGKNIKEGRTDWQRTFSDGCNLYLKIQSNKKISILSLEHIFHKRLPLLWVKRVCTELVSHLKHSSFFNWKKKKKDLQSNE